MVAAGIMGLPPTNGVLPQAPMHTHALSVSCDCFFPFLFFPSTHEKVRVRGRRRKFKRAKKTHSFLVSTLLKNKKVAAGERARRIAAAAEVEERQAEAEAEAAAGAAAAAENGGGFGLQRRRPLPPAPKKKSPSPPASAASTTASALPAALPQHDHHHHHHHHQPLEPLETRLASLLQYLAILACAFAGPVMRLVPRGAIAGYFDFMAFEWVGDSEMVDRLRWLCSDASGRASVRRPVAAFAAAAVPASSSSKASESASSSCPSSAAAAAAAPPLPPPPPPPPPARWTRAPTKSIAAFTAFQLACVALVYALTWVPVAGILFPVPIMLFVPLRTYVLPRVFGRAQIELLDGP